MKMNVLHSLLNVLPEATGIIAAANKKLAEMRSELDKVLAENNDKQYIDQLLTRLQIGDISLPKALKEAKITLETKKRTAKNRQSDEKTDANIPSNNSTPEYYRGSDGAYDGSYENLQDSNTSDPYGKGSPQSSSKPENKNVGSAPTEVYQSSDWESQFKQFNMDRSDDRRTYENDNLNRNDTSGFSTNSVQTDGEPDTGLTAATAGSANSGDNTTNYAQNNNPQTWADNSKYKNIDPGLAQYSNASDTGQNENNQQDRKTEEPDTTVPSVNFEPNKESDSHGAGSGRRPTLNSQQTNESLNRGSNWERPSATSDGAVVSLRNDTLRYQFTRDRQLGNNSSKENVDTRTDLGNYNTSDDYSPLNSDNQNVNSEYDTNYNTSDIEYSDYSPLNTDDQPETFNSNQSTTVNQGAAQANNKDIKDRSTQPRETNYFNDIESSQSYNEYSPLNGDNQNMSTYPDAQSQNQSSDSGSEGFDDEIGSDSANWNQSEEIHTETLNSSQQKSHSPNKNNNFSNSAHGSAAPSNPRPSAHSETVDRTSDEIKHMERFDNNNFASSADSSATQNSNTDIGQMHQPGKSSQAKPDALDEQSQNYNLNSADNEHSSNQSETNQRLDQSYNSASNQATDKRIPANPSNETQPDDFQDPDESSLSRSSSFDSSINQSSSASSDVPKKAPKIHPLDVICNTLDKRTKDKEEIITAEALFKKYKMGGKFVRNMLRAFPLPELIRKNPEVAEAVDDLVNYLSDPRNKLNKDQQYLKRFFARRGYGSKD